MTTEIVQRWNSRRSFFRPAGELINTSAYEVAALDSDSTAKAFVLAHHYSGTFPAARWRFGLYRAAQLVGVAVFSHPSNDAVLTSVFPGKATDSVELGRFVLLDDVPGNGETWFLARCFEGLRSDGLRGVVSFSDPIARRDEHGQVVTPGHVGTIYQAHNGVYLGRGTARSLSFFQDGTVFSDRAKQKIRAQDRGWEYAVEQLVAHGAPAPAQAANLREWLRAALALTTTTKRHPGNYKYAWGFSRADKRALPSSLPYPKKAA